MVPKILLKLLKTKTSFLKEYILISLKRGLGSIISLITMFHFLKWDNDGYLGYIYYLGLITPFAELSKFSALKLILSEQTINNAARIYNIAKLNHVIFILTILIIYSFTSHHLVLIVGLLKFSQGIKDLNSTFGYRLFGTNYDIKTIFLSLIQLSSILVIAFTFSEPLHLVNFITLTYLSYIMIEYLMFRFYKIIHTPAWKYYKIYMNYGLNNLINSANNNVYRVVLKTYYTEILIVVEVFANVFKIIELLINSLLQSLSRKLRELARTSFRRVMKFLKDIYFISGIIYFLIGSILIVFTSQSKILIALLVLGKYFSTCLSPMKSILQSKRRVTDQLKNYLQVSVSLFAVVMLYKISGNKFLLELLLLIPSITLFLGTLYNVRKSFET